MQTNITCNTSSTTLLFNISVMAASSIANIVKSSLGPVGLDKMLVDDVGVSAFRFIQDLNSSPSQG